MPADTDSGGGAWAAADKVISMRGFLIIAWLALGTVGFAKPLFDQYRFFGVQAPEDWGPGTDPLGLKLPGSAWVTNKERKSVMGVATMPANTPEEKKIAVEMISSALSEQLTRKGFRCNLVPTTVAGQVGGIVQGVNKLNQRAAVVVTRYDSAVAIVFYIVDASVSTEAYGANLKGLVDSFRWAKVKPGTK